ncbi:hypothetical protein K431DRAFT_287481 [Polychaeton citri CBS 116435]|uniref:Uncharacterized protein n=1 Tax=Polychaeton citri CBS 116435 TaxID=1314669 RepID=A0A9P4Q532_9PEZI|nr:hypothetical protein K431DRAFT_287481 [Polychaeton citri CBS 116435]
MSLSSAQSFYKPHNLKVVKAALMLLYSDVFPVIPPREPAPASSDLTPLSCTAIMIGMFECVSSTKHFPTLLHSLKIQYQTLRFRLPEESEAGTGLSHHRDFWRMKA